MSKLKYVSDEFLDDFKTNFHSKYLLYYINNDKEKIINLFSDTNNVYDSLNEFEYKELILESLDSEAPKKNVEIIWESLKHLTIAEAENEKIWVALENTYYLDYHLDQLSNINGTTREASITARTIFNRGNKMNTTDKIINDLAVQLANKSIECANYKAYFEEVQEQYNALLSVLESDKDLMDLFNEIKNKNEVSK